MAYLIAYDKCKLQYVDETRNKLNNRFNWHNSYFKFLSNIDSVRFLERYSVSPCSVLMRENTDQNNSEYGHFLRSGSVTIILKWEGAGRTDQNSMDKSCQPLRKARESYWMMELRTIYPYDPNAWYGDE